MSHCGGYIELISPFEKSILTINLSNFDDFSILRGCPQGILLAHYNGIQNTLQLRSKEVQTLLNTIILKQMSSFIIIQMQQNNKAFS